MRKLVFAALAALAAGMAAATIVPFDEPMPGRWCGDIDKCVAYAESHSMPLLAVWGSSTCGHCRNLAQSMETGEFVSWAAARKLVMCYGEDDDRCKAFCKDGTKHLTYYPFVCVYWPKGGKGVKNNFSGIRENMPVRSEKTLAGCLIASVEKYIKGYEYIDPESGEVAFASVPREMALAFNACLYGKRSCTVPLLVPTESGELLAGTLSVSVSSANRVTAKYSGVSGKAVTVRGVWATLNTKTGVVSCRLEKKPSGCVACGGSGNVALDLVLTMGSDGLVTAEVETDDPVFGGLVTGSARTDSVAAANADCVLAFTGGSGTGTATAAIRRGKATVKLTMADGTKVSAPAVVGADAEGNVVVPVFKVTNSRAFGALLTLSEDGGALVALPGTCAYQAVGGAVEPLDVLGCASGTKLSPAAICAACGLGTRLTLSLDGVAAAEIEAGEKKFVLVEKTASVTSFTYGKKDGSFSGKAKLDVGTGKPVSATVKGVLMPALAAAGGPLGVGTAYCKVRVNGKSAAVSVPVSLDAAE